MKRCTDLVKIGSIVRTVITTIIKDNKQNEITVEIVGSGESDLQNNKISYDSPIGKALLELKAGEQRRARIPRGEIEIKIIQMFNDWEEAEKIKNFSE